MAFADSDTDDLFAAPKSAASPFDVTALINAARQYYWIPILTLAAAIVCGLIFIQTSKPLYRCSGEIRVERTSATQAITVSGDSSSNDATSPEDLKTIIHSFISSTLIDKVIDQLDLLKKDNFLGKNRPAGSVTRGELAGYIATHTKVALIPDTRLIEVSFDHWNPEDAEKVANALLEQGIENDRKQRAAAVSANVKYLEEEVGSLEANLVASEQRLNEYTQQVGVSVDQDSNIVSDKLKDLNMRVTGVRSERMRLESDYDEIQAWRHEPDKLIGIDSIRRSPGVASQISRANDLRGNLAKLLQRYRPANPFVVQATTELREVEASLRQEALNVAQGIESALTSAKRNEENIAREKAEQEEKVIAIQKQSIPSNVLKRKIEADRLLYEAALNRLNEGLSQTRSMPVLLQIAKPAGGPYKVTTPPARVLTMAVFCGLLLGVGIIVLIVQLDASIQTIEQAESLLRLSVFAAVPRYLAPVEGTREEGGEMEEKKTSRSRTLALPDLGHSPMIFDAYSATAESFRTLRAAIQNLDLSSENRAILITSPLPGEGKSFCALNLAVAMAQSGERTLLVDAQLRKPVLEQRIFSSKGHRGLTDFLQGTAGLANIIRTTTIANFDVVTAGSATRQMGELLSPLRFQEFLIDAEPHYDRIIFDSTPLVTVSDALCFARLVSTVCVVVQAGKTQKKAAERSLELLKRSGATPSGLIMDCCETTRKGAFGQEAFAVTPFGKDLDFPKSCPGCGRVYENFDDYLRRTFPSGGTPSSIHTETADLIRNLEFFRYCECGTPVVAASDNRRDVSEAGLYRRQLFGDLHNRLIDAGLPREEAREKLLLILKIWRNEIENASDTSAAGLRRSQLFQQLQDELVKSGLEPREARNKLLQTIGVWREAK